jgi:predicted phage tail protein
MQTVMLYGFLGREFGRVHRYDVRSPAEAVRAMCVTLKGFRKAVADGGYYRVLVAGKDSLTADQLVHPVSQRESIRIVPVVSGAKNGWGQVILGAVLLAVAVVGMIFAPQFAPVWGVVGDAGFALMLGGVVQLLFAPKTAESTANDRPENRPSYTFDGAVNTAAQGNPVPVFYGGPLIIGSQVISAGLSVEQI